MLTRLGSLLRALTRRGRFEHGMAEELRFHIDQYTSDLVQAGVPRAEAARRARMEFGSVDSVKDDCRQASGLRLLDEVRRHVRYTLRLLRRTPAFTVTALATLALCLGANLTIFAVVDAILLRPLPFPDADRLVRVFNTYPRANVPDDGASVANYYERRGSIAGFEGVALYQEGTITVGEPGSAEREPIARVSPDFFSTLGVGLVMGRAFTEADTNPRTDSVAIVTDAYWRQRLHADGGVIGRRIRVDGFEMTVVGVLPPGFSFLSSPARLYFPRASGPGDRTSARRHWGSSSHMVARLRPGVTLAQAQAQIDAQNAAIEAQQPSGKMMADAGFRTLVVPLHADHVAAIRPVLLLLQAGALSLLLIGGVNLVNLLLIRASGRMKELAVRQALGASRRRVVGEVLVETTVLTLAGGLLGVPVASFGIQLLAVLGTDRLPLGTHIALDARVAAIAIGGAIVTGLAIGIPIAWYHLRGHATNALHTESRSSTTSRAVQRLRHGFLVAQLALTFVLLAGAGLLGLSLQKAMAVAPGFRPDHVLSGQVSLPGKSYPDNGAMLTFTERLVEELRRQPGVQAAAIVTNVPMSGRTIKSSARVKGHVRQPGEAPRGVYSYGVGGDYFSALGVSLIEGRFLTSEDSRRAERVCVVDEDFARHYWPNRSALGQRLFEGGSAVPNETDADAYTIVGVVAPVKQAGLTADEAPGAIFYPIGRRLDRTLFVVTRTSLAPESTVGTLRAAVRTLDPELPVSDIRTMDARIADSMITRRSPAVLAGLFSAMAMLLTAIGTYGVLSYAVAQRRREIALRVALGAQPAQVRRQFVSLALRLLAAGLTLGLAGAWLMGRGLQALLFQVPPLHAATLAATALILGLVALAACLLPSHRAARISPMEALIDQ